jgi:hypothetical protein
VRRLCVDEDTSDKLAGAVRKLRPHWDVVFVREWAGSGLKDQVLLELLWQDRRALISRDRATLPDWIKDRQAQGVGSRRRFVLGRGAVSAHRHWRAGAGRRQRCRAPHRLDQRGGHDPLENFPAQFSAALLVSNY